MTNWMRALARHYQKKRAEFPNDRLMIVFDIDNTIIDMREMIAHVLKAYDDAHGTCLFDGLAAADLTINENQVDELLGTFDLDVATHQHVLAWYLEKRWTSEAILSSHRPFAGVMEVIRWFQMQPLTYVGLNTGRPEVIREDTLRSLNALGAAFKVQFADEWMFMNPGDWSADVTYSKTVGIQRFRDMGFRVFAVVDNEPDNLEAIGRINGDGSILLLHADTIFDSKRSRLPRSSVSGNDYDLTELISEKSLPEHVQFVWHGVNDEANLRQFLASSVRWCECDARLDPPDNAVVLRHDSFGQRLRRDGEELLGLDAVLKRIVAAKKAIKIDIKERGPLLERVVNAVNSVPVPDEDLWINGNMLELGREGFERLGREFPNATLQCPVDFMVPVITMAPSIALEKLDAYHSWGVHRFSLEWGAPRIRRTLQQLSDWGFQVNLYNIPDLQSFLRAVLLQPRSITADFNFPKWHYYGRGAGKNLRHHTYALDDRPERYQVG